MTLGKPEEQRSLGSLTALPQEARKAEMRGVARILGGSLAKPGLGPHSTMSWLKVLPSASQELPELLLSALALERARVPPPSLPLAGPEGRHWCFPTEKREAGSAYVNPVGGGLGERLPGSLPHLLGRGCPVRSPYTPAHSVGNWGASGPRL